MRSAFWSIVATVSVASGPALAAEPAAAPSDVIFFIVLAVLILVGRLSGELMQRIGQPAVMGQLIAGLVLGPSVFGAFAPHLQHQIFDADPAQKAMLDGISQLGILMLLLLTGMETDLKLGGHDLIVMGVDRRSSEVLDFGPLAADVMAATEASILFVSG